MTELIQQLRPAIKQLGLDSQVPPHALRNALLALGAGLLVMSGLAALSTFWAPTRAWWDAAGDGPSMAAGVQASLLAAVATAVGALPVFLIQRVSKLQEAALLSFAAGVMLAAAVFALLLPALDAGEILLGHRLGGALLSGAGLAMGMALMIGVDRLTPHEHAVLPPATQGHAMRHAGSSAQGAKLMVLAILIHNVPEGLAVGAAYAGVQDAASARAGASVALAIGLQNMPEGLIVAMALRTLGQSAARAWASLRSRVWQNPWVRFSASGCWAACRSSTRSVWPWPQAPCCSWSATRSFPRPTAAGTKPWPRPP
jgi:ZIP family zinc transporter